MFCLYKYIQLICSTKQSTGTYMSGIAQKGPEFRVFLDRIFPHQD